MDQVVADPLKEVVQDLRSQWKKETDTFGRVFSALLHTHQYTHYSEIADTADCSSNSAKKHLDRLDMIGIADRNEKLAVALYQRNNAYIEWLTIHRIADKRTLNDIIEEVEYLEERCDEFRDLFGVSTPVRASANDVDSDEEIHELMESLTEWRKIEHHLYLCERARQVLVNKWNLGPNPEVTNEVPSIPEQPDENE